MSSDRIEQDIEQIELALGYRFNSPALLENALTRRSFWHENKDTCAGNNERMEFLGDAVLGMVVAAILYSRFPDYEEGELQKMRASLVNRAALAQLMRQLNLARYIRMGRGDEISGCRDLDSILADTLEAIVASVYLDGGFAQVEKIIERHFYPLIERCDTREGTTDFKSILQERSQRDLGITPHYRLLDEWGEDHDKTFVVAVFLEEEMAGQGTGRNKREAAQNAASQALEQLEKAATP